MALSAITQITKEGYALDLATFVRAGSLYALWTTGTVVNGIRDLWWKVHDGADATETRADFTTTYRDPFALVADNGTLLVTFSQAGGVQIIGFDFTTGATILTPREVVSGSHGVLLKLPDTDPGQIHIAYVDDHGQVRLGESLDNGATWRVGIPLLNAKVRDTIDLFATEFDGGHVSLMQLGHDARRSVELGHADRTRPLAGIIAHPTAADRYVVVEAAQRQVAAVSQLSETNRAALAPYGTGFITGTHFRQGTADGIGDAVVYDTSGASPVVSEQATIGAGATSGADLATFNLAPLAAGSIFNSVLGAVNGAVVGVAVSSSHLYAAGYSDVAEAQGALGVVRIADGVTAQPLTGVAVRAVAVCNTCVPAVIAVATTEGGAHKLRIYTENGLTPTLTATHKLPAQPIALHVVMTTPTTGTIYVAMTDRFNTYFVKGLAAPIRLRASTMVLTRGTVHGGVFLSTGHFVAAMGLGGAMVVGPEGETLTQIIPSGIQPNVWTARTVYALNALVRPTDGDPYAPRHRYFICTVGGTSGNWEPAWQPNATVTDGTASWVEVGSTDPYVTGVAVDRTRRRIYAVGNVGGPTGTIGRVWTLDGGAAIPPA